MIGRATFTNYRCFRQLDVPLAPLTVAIGPNDTGKSTFLQALAAAASGAHSSEEPRWTFHGQGGRAKVRLDAPQAHVLVAALPVAGPAMSAGGVTDGAPHPGMEAGVPAVLDWMLRKHRPRYDALVEAIRASIPGVRDISVAVPDAGSRRLDLVGEDGWERPADEGSAGVRLMLYFLTLAWHPSPPDVVLIEEPETGLHPARLREVVGLLRGLTEGRHAPHPVQVVLTTHSPYLLDFIDPTKDQVLVFRRGADGACTAAPVDVPRVQGLLHDFGLGEIWGNEGEAGLVGGA